MANTTTFGRSNDAGVMGANVNWMTATMALNGNMSPTPFSGFSSVHSGGAHFLMGDGAVRFISDSIATGPVKTPGSTYQNLATINDGVPVNDY